MRTFIVRRSISISTQPATPADAVSPAAPHRGARPSGPGSQNASRRSPSTVVSATRTTRVPQRRARVAQRVVGRRIQPPERLRQQPDRRAGQDGPDVLRVRAAEAAGLQQRRRRRRRRAPETPSPTARRRRRSAGVRHRAAPQMRSAPSASALADARHRRQFGGRHRHAEQAHRQQRQRRRVRQRGDRAARQPGGQQRVDVAAELHDAAADEHRHEVPDDRAHVARTPCRARRADPARAAARTGSCTANCSALPATDPHARIHRQRRQRRAAAKQQQRGDHRHVPHDAGRVRQQEPVMAVEHAQAPRGQHEQAGRRETASGRCRS